MKDKVALIGVYPPPIGGISVHIRRLSDYLDRQGIAYTIYDNTEGEKDKPVRYTGAIERWCLAYFWTAREKVIHCHFLRWQVRFLLSLLALRGKRVLFTVHSYRHDPQEDPFWKRVMIRLTGRLAGHFICVSQTIANDLIKAGIPPEKTSVIPGFIPPEDEASPPGKLMPLLERSSPLLVANGAIGAVEKGVDLYGADLCLELAAALRKEHPNMHLLFCVTHVVDEAYFERLQRRIRERDLSEHVTLWQEQTELYPLLKRADVFLRPTSSDGDALSVREALWFGTPVVASDCVQRPKGVMLFENRRLESLLAETRKVLREKPQSCEQPHNFAQDIVALYEI